MDLRELEQLIDLLRAKGVMSYQSETMALTLGPEQRDAAAKGDDNREDEEPEGDDMAFAHVGGRVKMERNTFKKPEAN